MDIFYDTRVVCCCLKIVCCCSKFIGFKEAPWCVTLYHYINDQLPKFHSLIPPTTVEHSIADIERHVRRLSYAPFLKGWKSDQVLSYVLNLPNHIILLSQQRVLVNQNMI